MGFKESAETKAKEVALKVLDTIADYLEGRSTPSMYRQGAAVGGTSPSALSSTPPMYRQGAIVEGPVPSSVVDHLPSGAGYVTGAGVFCGAAKTDAEVSAANDDNDPTDDAEVA
jgi:hypothetical protein